MYVYVPARFDHCFEAQAKGAEAQAAASLVRILFRGMHGVTMHLVL